MKDVDPLNKPVEEEALELVIAELTEKEEFLCTGDVCGAKGCGINA